MRKALSLSALLFLLVAPGCMLVDYAVDPVGCGTGSHKPIFPWYPSYLWNPPRTQSVPLVDPAATPGCNCTPARGYDPAPLGDRRVENHVDPR